MMGFRRTFPVHVVLHFVLLYGVSVHLGGCAAVPGRQQEPTTYVLDTAVDLPTADRVGDKTLLVASSRTEPGFDTTRIAYTRAPLTLEYYSKSQWADTPARMLTPLLVRALESTAMFGAILTPPASANADLRLDLTLIRLQQEFLQQPSRVRLALRICLTDTGTHRVLASSVFEVVEPAPSEDAYGGVQAANAAVNSLFRQIAEFLVEYS
jgi:cholesterol transport system auxiliary component